MWKDLESFSFFQWSLEQRNFISWCIVIWNIHFVSECRKYEIKKNPQKRNIHNHKYCAVLSITSKQFVFVIIMHWGISNISINKKNHTTVKPHSCVGSKSKWKLCSNLIKQNHVTRKKRTFPLMYKEVPEKKEKIRVLKGFYCLV